MNSAEPRVSHEDIRRQVFRPDEDCPHDETAIRRKLGSNGVARFWQQCLRCGVKRDSVPRASLDDPDSIPLFDEELPRRMWAAYHEDYSKVRDKLETELRDFRSAEYQKYLQSSEWRSIRETVLKRDNHLCQGCRIRSATEVHHLTYAHVFHEFLFELISVCESCHRRLHSSAPGPQSATSAHFEGLEALLEQFVNNQD